MEREASAGDEGVMGAENLDQKALRFPYGPPAGINSLSQRIDH